MKPFFSKSTFNFFALIFAFSILSFSTHTYETIFETGINNLEINRSNLKDVKKKFRDGKVVKEKVFVHSRMFAKSIDGSCRYMEGKERKAKYVSYVIQDLGLEFNFRDREKLKSIVFTQPAKFRTEKGIVAGVSTFGDLEEKYGKMDWHYNKWSISKVTGNLNFHSSDSLTKDNIGYEDLKNVDLHSLVIESIVVQ